MDFTDPTVLALVASGIAIAGATGYFMIQPKRVIPKQKYGIPVPGTAAAGSSQVFRNWRIEGKDLVSCQGDLVTLYDLSRYVGKKFSSKNALGTRKVVQIITEEKVVHGQKKNWSYTQLGPFSWITYTQFLKQVDDFGSGLAALGLKKGDNLAIYAETKAEWTIAAHGAFTQSAVALTVYANLGVEPTIFALNEGETKIILTDKELLKGLLDMTAKVKHIQSVICTDEEAVKDEKMVKAFESKGISLYSFAQVLQLGAQKPVPAIPPKSDDVAVIMYTSGTTGNPKGVMLTHKNCIASILGTIPMTPLKTERDQAYLSYLPLAHILAFIIEQGMLFLGNDIGYGSPRTLLDNMVRNCRGDIQELRPTFFVGVPSVYEKVKEGVLSKIERAPAVAKTLFHMAYEAKRTSLENGYDTPIWNKLVFNAFKAGLGGRVTFFVSGGAPLSPSTAEFLQICFGVPVINGYGLTETCGASCAVEAGSLDIHAKTIGSPTLSTEFKLVDVPDMGYLTTNNPPKGEIWIRGNGVGKGYYKNPQKTAEEFTPDGWFKTGDIGQLNPNGTFSVIDRKKNLVKPPHGEYIAPERLEAVYKTAAYVESIMVYASATRNELIALIKPKKELQSADSAKTVKWEDFVETPEAEKAILEALQLVWKVNNLKSIERIYAVKLFPDEWTPANGWLTAAMKLRRQDMQKQYAGLIDKIYQKLPKA